MNDENSRLVGTFTVECRDADGNVKWVGDAPNLVTTEGKNTALDTFLAGSAYTATGPFLGLIDAQGYGVGPVAGDIMTSHTGWVESGDGTSSRAGFAARQTTNTFWSAATAGEKQLSSARSFTITAAGTIKGCFLVYQSGALSTIGSTAGKLYSAGTFSSDKTVAINDTISVSYKATLN